MMKKTITAILFILFPIITPAQSILPPLQEWHGKSESLIAKSTNTWITPTEKSGFFTTPDYATTMSWLKKLADASPLLSRISIGKSPEGRDIFMIIASSEKKVTAAALKQSGKPLLLVQAGIHSGEIDGKDAGMMLLRDIAMGGKKQLLDKVNLLFIPILNVDEHERSSSFNRPNQRGPQNMGWRTNAQNLNLNRDYAKLDTKEVRAVIKVMNEYDPLLYMDIHVTDGADYQYDITYALYENQGYSKSITNWLTSKFKTNVDRDLSANGHVQGEQLTPVNDRDFTKGNLLTIGEPRFSNAYGDLRHMATMLIETHSLKPYKQRVLGTYVLLESVLKILATDGQLLKQNTLSDRAKREPKVNMKWRVPHMANAMSLDSQFNSVKKNDLAIAPDSLKLLGIASKILKSVITNADYVTWTGEPTTMTIANLIEQKVIALRADMDGLPVEEKNNLPYASKAKPIYNGKPSHGASPWSSIDPIVVSAQIINSLQTIVSRNINLTKNPAVVTVGAINGCNRFNIIPEQVEMLGTIRTFTDADEALVFKKVKLIAEKTAEAAGATAIVELPYSVHYPVTFNNIKLTNAMLPTLQKSAGKNNVLLVPAITGAVDFSFFQQKVPGLYFFIGGLPKGADAKLSGDHHTPQFIIDDSAFKTGLNAFCNLVFDYIELHKK